MKTEENQDSWNIKIEEIVAPARRGMSDSFDRDPFEFGSGVRILPPASKVATDLPADSVLHVMAQFVLEGRAQVAEYSASASASIRGLLARARSRRFEAEQQAKARRLMLSNYRSALTQHADAQRILGPHVRLNGTNAKGLWILFFLIGDSAAMTLALTYGGENPYFSVLMSLAIGAAVIVIGKTAEDVRRESLVKTIKSTEDPETNRVVDAVFGMNESGRLLNRRVLLVFALSSLIPAIAVLVYRTAEESFAIGLSFALWTVIVGCGSFAASWFYCDPAKAFIGLTKDAVEEAEEAWQSTEFDAIEEHNGSIEAARHIVEEFRQRADSSWSLTLAGAASALVANSSSLGIAQSGGHWLLNQEVPMVRWPELENYLEILDDVDGNLGESDDLFPVIFGDDTNQVIRPTLKN
jgi:hypothetical protein